MVRVVGPGNRTGPGVRPPDCNLATAVLVVWTPNSVESRWVRGEAREAADRGILVPVRFDNATLPIDVRAFHTTDVDDSRAVPECAVQRCCARSAT